MRFIRAIIDFSSSTEPTKGFQGVGKEIKPEEKDKSVWSVWKDFYYEATVPEVWLGFGLKIPLLREFPSISISADSQKLKISRPHKAGDSILKLDRLKQPPDKEGKYGYKFDYLDMRESYSVKNIIKFKKFKKRLKNIGFLD